MLTTWHSELSIFLRDSVVYPAEFRAEFKVHPCIEHESSGEPAHRTLFKFIVRKL
jgi:hypothetical protein